MTIKITDPALAKFLRTPHLLFQPLRAAVVSAREFRASGGSEKLPAISDTIYDALGIDIFDGITVNGVTAKIYAARQGAAPGAFVTFAAAYGAVLLFQPIFSKGGLYSVDGTSGGGGSIGSTPDPASPRLSSPVPVFADTALDFADDMPAADRLAVQRKFCNAARFSYGVFGNLLNTAALKKYVTASHVSETVKHINDRAIEQVITEAQQNYEFMLKFNGEMFRPIGEHNKRLTPAETREVFRRHKELIDLTDENNRVAFTTLYAMAVYKLESADAFSVDSVFAPQVGREKDNIKRRAGQAVYEIMTNGSDADVSRMVAVVKEFAAALPSSPRYASLSEIKQLYPMFGFLSQFNNSK